LDRTHTSFDAQTNDVLCRAKFSYTLLRFFLCSCRTWRSNLGIGGQTRGERFGKFQVPLLEALKLHMGVSRVNLISLSKQQPRSQFWRIGLQRGGIDRIHLKAMLDSERPPIAMNIPHKSQQGTRTKEIHKNEFPEKEPHGPHPSPSRGLLQDRG